MDEANQVADLVFSYKKAHVPKIGWKELKRG
jgi:hypothetical protein